MTIAELKEKNITELTKIADHWSCPAPAASANRTHLQDPAGAK